MYTKKCIMNINISKQELSSLVFTEQVKTDVENTLKSHYGVKNVNYRLLNYGMGIEISGSDSFNFIKGAVVKVTGLPSETFSVMSEDQEKCCAFYVYMPEKDRMVYKRIPKDKIKS